MRRSPGEQTAQRVPGQQRREQRRGKNQALLRGLLQQLGQRRQPGRSPGVEGTPRLTALVKAAAWQVGTREAMVVGRGEAMAVPGIACLLMAQRFPLIAWKFKAGSAIRGGLMI